MDLSFAKDSNIFSQAVEELRSERADLTDAKVIEERYNKLAKGTKKTAKKAEEKPKKKAKSKKK